MMHQVYVYLHMHMAHMSTIYFKEVQRIINIITLLATNKLR